MACLPCHNRCPALPFHLVSTPHPTPSSLSASSSSSPDRTSHYTSVPLLRSIPSSSSSTDCSTATHSLTSYSFVQAPAEFSLFTPFLSSFCSVHLLLLIALVNMFFSHLNFHDIHTRWRLLHPYSTSSLLTHHIQQHKLARRSVDWVARTMCFQRMRSLEKCGRTSSHKQCPISLWDVRRHIELKLKRRTNKGKCFDHFVEWRTSTHETHLATPSQRRSDSTQCCSSHRIQCRSPNASDTSLGRSGREFTRILYRFIQYMRLLESTSSTFSISRNHILGPMAPHMKRVM